MNKFNTMILQIISLLLFDLIILTIWIYIIKPSPSGSILLILYLPFLFFLNLIISLIIKFVKKEYSLLFLINAFISPILFFNLYNYFTDYFLVKTYTRLSFNANYNNYEIVIYKNSKNFHLYKTPFGDSTSIEEAIYGNIKEKKNGYYLYNDSLKMEIIDDKLIGFNKGKKSFPLQELEY